MRCIRVAIGARQQLGLLLGVAAVALSLLALHQLSSNHIAAGPGAPAGITANLSSAPAHVDDHGLGAGRPDHAHPGAVPGEQHPASEDDGCPACAGHSAMALTCLAVLVLLTLGLMLTGPAAWRGLLRQRQLLPRTPASRLRLPQARSLAELSVCRT